MSFGTRGLGQTTTMIGTLYQNKDAVFIVDSFRTQRLVQNQHPMLKDRIFTVEETINGKLMGRKCFLVWDNEAVFRYSNTVCDKAFQEGKVVDGMEEMLKKQEKKSQVEISPSYDTFKQLADVLKRIGDLFGVNVFIVPKPKEK